jgi:TetR/AcrR family transcriptional regulator, cholesterol catabolism regulator
MVQTANGNGESPRVLARKREILRAASTLFRRQGLHGTGMRDIAAAAGMAVGNLYYYFRDKRELLAFCQEDALAALLELAAWVRSLPQGPDQKLYLLVVGHVLVLHEESPGAVAHLDVDALAPEARQAVVARRDAYEGSCRQLLHQGVDAGVFRPLDPKLAGAAILGAVNWTAQWYHPGGDRSPRQLGEQLAELLLRGVLAEGRRLQPPVELLPGLVARHAQPVMETP